MNARVSCIVRKPSGSSPSYVWPGSRLCQFGVSSVSESQRSVRQVLATSPRSRTTWSIERAASHQLIASPAWPAPITTAVVRIRRGASGGEATLRHLDGDVGRVGDDVVDRGALLRLRDDRLDVVRRRVGVDLVGHLDAVEAVAHVLVHTEDAADVHSGLERRRHGTQLDLTRLSDSRYAGGQAACESGQHDLHRRGRVVLGGEHLGVVGVEGELLLVLLLGAQAIEALDGGAAVRTVDPLDRRAPLELRRFRRVLQRRLCAEQSFDVDPIVDGLVVLCCRHWILLSRFKGEKSTAVHETYDHFCWQAKSSSVGKLNRLLQTGLP